MPTCRISSLRCTPLAAAGRKSNKLSSLSGRRPLPSLRLRGWNFWNADAVCRSLSYAHRTNETEIQLSEDRTTEKGGDSTSAHIGRRRITYIYIASRIWVEHRHRGIEAAQTYCMTCRYVYATPSFAPFSPPLFYPFNSCFPLFCAGASEKWEPENARNMTARVEQGSRGSAVDELSSFRKASG